MGKQGQGPPAQSRAHRWVGWHPAAPSLHSGAPHVGHQHQVGAHGTLHALTVRVQPIHTAASWRRHLAGRGAAAAGSSGSGGRGLCHLGVAELLRACCASWRGGRQRAQQAQAVGKLLQEGAHAAGGLQRGREAGRRCRVWARRHSQGTRACQLQCKWMSQQHNREESREALGASGLP